MPICPICGTITSSFCYEKKQVQFHRCLGCGFTFKNSKDILSSKEEYTLYDRHNNSIDDPVYVAFFTRFLKDAVFPFMGVGRNSLDFGSGPSPVLATLMEQYYGYHFDIYDKFYAPKPVYQGKHYDLITCTEVLEHIYNPINTFRLFTSMMHEESLLSVMTLLRPKMDKDFLNWHYMRDMTHISFFTVEAMELIAKQCGLEIVYQDGVRYTSFRKQRSKRIC